MSHQPPSAIAPPPDSESWDGTAYNHHLKIEFTGSGREYRCIWLWNFCWILLTLGLYYPWALVHKKRYFYQHTLVGGCPLNFDARSASQLHGD